MFDFVSIGFFLALFIIVNIFVHELAHWLAFFAFGISSKLGVFAKRFHGWPIPVGFEIIPKNWKHSIGKQLVISAAGFAGSCLTSLAFYAYANSLTEVAVLIIFPFLLSLLDFKAIIILSKAPWKMGVDKATRLINSNKL